MWWATWKGYEWMTNAQKKNGTTAHPDYLDTDTTTLDRVRFPAPVRSEFRIYFEEDAYREMMKHAQTTSEVELGGVLVGDVCCDDSGPYLQIKGSIAAEAADSRNARMTFTHESWDHINRVRDDTYPRSNLVGWYHTHPGFGIFLSEMDLFIQEHFFNQPFQIAMVIETKSRRQGCFVWENGVPTPVRRMWVGQQELPLAGVDESSAKEESVNMNEMNTHEEESLTPAFIGGLLKAALVILVLVLGGYAFMRVYGKLLVQQNMMIVIMSAHEEGLKQNAQLKQELLGLREAQARSSLEIQKKMEGVEVQIATLAQTLEGLEKQIAETMGPGDFQVILESIRKHGGDGVNKISELIDDLVKNLPEEERLFREKLDQMREKIRGITLLNALPGDGKEGETPSP